MKNKTLTATSLIEVLLYVSLLSIVIVSIGAFITQVLSARNKQRAIIEVETEVLMAVELIKNDLKRATSVTNPVAGGSGAGLTMSINESGSPVIREYSLVNGRIMQKIGTQSAVAITSNMVTISNLSFTHIFTAPKYHIIGISFDIKYLNPSNQTDQNYLRTINTSVEIKEND